MLQSLKDKMNAISEQGLCIGCGICQSLAGKENIKLAKTSNGFERPVIVGKLSEELVHLQSPYEAKPSRVISLPI